jgi:hypothetical protein
VVSLKQDQGINCPPIAGIINLRGGIANEKLEKKNKKT